MRLFRQKRTANEILNEWDMARITACKDYDTYEEYVKAFPDPTSFMFLSEYEWDKLRPTFKVMKSKAKTIINIFKEWENDINRTGEKLYR